MRGYVCANGRNNRRASIGRTCVAACRPCIGAAMAPPILLLRDIRLTFGGTPLLEGADLSVSAGDRLCLVGRNGSGKSTLLKVAAGIVDAQGGEIFRQPGVSLRYLPQEPD